MGIRQVGAAVLLFAAAGQALEAASPEESCNCEKPSVSYIVVEMPPQASSSAVPPTPVAVNHAAAVKEADIPTSSVPAVAKAPSSVPARNFTTTYYPVVAPDVDCSRPENFIPSKNINLYYGAGSSTSTANSTVPAPGSHGLINMTLAMNNAAVALEYIDSITTVNCDDDLMTVTFNGSQSFDNALSAWTDSLEDTLLMITNHVGNCNDEFERGFFKVAKITSDADSNTISCSAAKQPVASIAESCEMDFSSMPAATLTKRISANPVLPLVFDHTIEDQTLFELDPNVRVDADEAAFHANVTFSGKLKYDFWGAKLKELWFDIDTSFSADLQMSAYVQADKAFSQTFQYAPGDLDFNLVDVPGVVSLGPGVAFGLGLDLATSGRVNVTAGAGIALAGGNVHLDFVNGVDADTSGWEPVYHSFANVSERAEVGANVTASVSVQLALKFLGGLVDLSSGLTARPGFNNHFSLAGAQNVDLENGIVLPNNTAASCANGFGLKSDFVFGVDAFITKHFDAELYNVTVPLADKCYSFV